MNPRVKRPYSRGTPYERALKYITAEPSGCWVWHGAKVTAGYGQIGIGGRKRKGAHIVVYEHHHGPVPDGLELDHLCRNRACCNPAHLEPVTHTENVRRGASTRRKCDHPESAFARRKDNGRIIHCNICRNARSRELYRQRQERAA